MIKVAAIADIHFSESSQGKLHVYWKDLAKHADLLLIGGDITTLGSVKQAEILVRELEGVSIPIVMVLGNHEYHSNQQDAIRQLLETQRIQVLEGEHVALPIHGKTIGIAGVKGFGGGFAGACGARFGEQEMKEFIACAEHSAMQLEKNLRALTTDYRIALLHYAPIKETIVGERLEIYPFLGSYLLGEAIDRASADLVIHGHAHHGREKGVTPGGIPVRNVALPLIKRAYNLYELGTFPLL